MASEASEAKRKRTEDSYTPNMEAAQRSAQFWFEDGNVVLQAQDSLFRVHRSHLILHSDVMKDCFSCPQPEGAPTIEGCPLIHLPDSKLDISNLCALLYSLYQIDVQGINTSYLGTMIRMGRKYNISFIKKSALTFLRNLFPQELAQWDLSQSEVKKLCSPGKPFLFEAINLAYANDIPSILPAAFLSMYTIYSLTTISSGIKVNDRRITLNSTALKRCLGARSTFLSSFFRSIVDDIDSCELDENTRNVYSIPCEYCEDSSLCSRGLTDIFASFTKWAPDSDPIKIPTDFLELLDISSPDDYHKNPFCEECSSDMRMIFVKERLSMWSEFPARINLPFWWDIKDFDM